MKYILRTFVFNAFALWLTSQLLPALYIPGGWQMIIIAGVVLGFLMLIVKPVLHILFIPINVITFNLLSWLIHVIVIYLLTVFLPEVQILPWTFPGFAWSGFVVPKMYLSYHISLIVTSLTITVIADTLQSLSND